MKEFEVEYGYITAYIKINEDENKAEIIVNFGEYADECDYSESKMENELECMWGDILDAVKAEGYVLYDQLKSDWIRDDLMSEEYSIKKI